MERKVSLSPEPGPVSTLSGNPNPGSKVVALGADHGGFAMKETLKAYLQELGYAIKDCGAFSSQSVDYPDFAYAVAKLVSEGQAWRGIMIDGAGIGSCMAANKVPGVRASMCYDLSTAVNAREHNDANVLTLGGHLIAEGLAKKIVKTWLETDFGGGRHERRVNKIMDIEKRYLRK
ncbi:MAG: ribose 5-phosphate isomerase B [Anaerolineales bacterium]|nr:ribose 5-phosphate isomerase B [Anaerolineales bacterium]